jgi:hypothetical protein
MNMQYYKITLYKHINYIGLYIFLCSIEQIIISYLKYLPSILGHLTYIWYVYVPHFLGGICED